MIFKLAPALKDYLWGGTKLKDQYNFKTNLDTVAEGWMLSCHKDGENKVIGGKYDGKTLNQIIDAEGKDILGINAQIFDFFPILVKLIDAKKDLSVQVHPNNEYALRVEGEYGKTECWYIIDCEDGAELIYGFNKKISNQEFKERIENNTFLDVVNRVKVKKGDLFFIEAGTLHAIGKGVLLAEIQQNSNTTYRVYDYNRLGADGKPRPLHTQKAIDVTVCEPPLENNQSSDLVICGGYSERLLTKCDLFTVTELNIEKSALREATQDSFVSLLIIDGSGRITNNGETLSLTKGDSIFISAGSGNFEIEGNLLIIETRV